MTEEIICTTEKLKNVILRMDQESESAYSYQAAEIIVQDALIRRHGTFCYGKPFTTETKDHIMELLKPDYIEGFSLLGGEPFEPENQEELVRLLKEIKDNYPKKHIWCYTGYTYDKDLLEGGKVYTPFTEEMLSYIDTLVDGQFIESQKDITLKFRGSANQRILDLNEK